MHARSTASLLGYPDDARLLIINADDLGLCHAENVATFVGLDQGAFCSSTVMVPCPSFREAAAGIRARPDADVGVHLTHTCEWPDYKWGPVCGPSEVPSLVDDDGNFCPDVPSVYSRARLDEVERETRAQIQTALAAGIDVTHLDSHMGTLQLDLAYHSLYVRVAAEFQLPIRMAGRLWMRDSAMGEAVELADRLGVLAPDHFWYGGPEHPDHTAAYWTGVLQHLQPGVSELFVHAAEDDPALRRSSPAWAQRMADCRFFTAPSTRALISEAHITLIGYRALRDCQRSLC